jgi:hypothetical protein
MNEFSAIPAFGKGAIQRQLYQPEAAVSEIGARE